MKKLLIFKILLLAAAMIGGTSSVCGEEVTETLTPSRLSHSGTANDVVSETISIFNFRTNNNYGSGATTGISTVENTSTVWTSGNIQMTVANRYVWFTDGTLRLYKSSSTAPAGTLTFTCPSNKVITKIEFSGVTGTGALSGINTDTGDYTVSGSSATWSGVYQTIVFTATASTYFYTITVTYGDIPVSISSARLSTFCAGVAADFNSASNITVYKAKLDDNVVKLTEITDGIVPANTGVILYCASAGNYTIPVTTTSSAISNNELIGTTKKTSVYKYSYGKSNYILQSDGIGGVIFNRANGSNMPAGKAYLSTSYNAHKSGSRLAIVFEEASAIHNVKDIVHSEKHIYNIHGQRVNEPTKGLYIINGEKRLTK